MFRSVIERVDSRDHGVQSLLGPARARADVLVHLRLLPGLVQHARVRYEARQRHALRSSAQATLNDPYRRRWCRGGTSWRWGSCGLRELDRGLGGEQPVDRSRTAVGQLVRVVRVGLIAAGVDVVIAHRHGQQPEAGRVGPHVPIRPVSPQRVDEAARRSPRPCWPVPSCGHAVCVEVAHAAAVHSHPERTCRRVRRAHFGPDHERLVAGDRAGIGDVAEVVELPSVHGARTRELDPVRPPGVLERLAGRHPERRGAGERRDQETAHGGAAHVTSRTLRMPVMTAETPEGGLSCGIRWAKRRGPDGRASAFAPGGRLHW